MSSSTSTRPSTVGLGLHAVLAELVGKPWFWALVVGLAMGLPLLVATRVSMPPPLPVLGTVPEFALTDQNGQRFSSEQLHGRVWVANFIFTRCPTICPVWTRRMWQIQHRARGMGDAFHLVSFTVDPDHDTPDKLLAYAQQNRVSPRMWSFLTGSHEDLKRIISDGIKVYMQKGSEPDDLMSIGHGSHFVLVDAKMQIRAYYQFDDAQALDHILRDAGLLAMRGY